MKCSSRKRSREKSRWRKGLLTPESGPADEKSCSLNGGRKVHMVPFVGVVFVGVTMKVRNLWHSRGFVASNASYTLYVDLSNRFHVHAACLQNQKVSF